MYYMNIQLNINNSRMLPNGNNIFYLLSMKEITLNMLQIMNQITNQKAKLGRGDTGITTAS